MFGVLATKPLSTLEVHVEYMEQPLLTGFNFGAGHVFGIFVGLLLSAVSIKIWLGALEFLAQAGI